MSASLPNSGYTSISSWGSVLHPNSLYTYPTTVTSSSYPGWITLGANTATATTFDSIYNDPYIKPLQNLTYSVEFEIDKNDILKNSIKSIKNKIISFKCEYSGNRIQPYEFIMKLINEGKKFYVNIKVSDVLSLCYKNFQFIKIENNLNFGDKCDFSVIKIKFKYDEILYQNHKLSLKELRTDKIKKIMNNEENEEM